MKVMPLALSALLVVGTALGDSSGYHQSLQPPPPTTRPAATQPRGPGDGFRGFNRGAGGPGPRFFLPFGDDAPTSAQIAEAEDFIKEHSPNHYSAYERLARSSFPHERMQLYIVRGYLDLQVLQTNDRPLYDMKLLQIKVQDDIFGVVSQFRTMDRASEAEKENLRGRLRPLEEQLIELRKEESKHRLKRIEAAAAAEKHNLDNLESGGEKLVDNLILQDIANGDRLLSPPFNFRRPERSGDR